MNDTFTPQPPGVPAPKSNMTLVVVAIGLGLLVALISALYTANVRKQAAADMEPVWSFVRPKDADEKFDMNRDVERKMIPRVALDSMNDVIVKESTLRNQHEQILRRPVQDGEFLSLQMFNTPEGTIDTKRIALDKSACALPINGRTAPAGLKPGMLVDILVTITPPGQLPQTYAVMGMVKVIGVGSQTDEGGGTSRSYSSITVEVSPEEAKAMVAVAGSPQISSQGFSLLIRHPNSPRTSTGVNSKVLDILRIEAPKGATGL